MIGRTVPRGHHTMPPTAANSSCSNSARTRGHAKLKGVAVPPSTHAAEVRLAVLVAEATIGRCLVEDGYLSARELSVDLRHAAAWLAGGARFGP